MINPSAIPLSLYIHLPWCIRKCPYCDFNSHEGFSSAAQEPYVAALLADLDSQRQWLSDRPIQSVFIGGGTPSLFEGDWIARLLQGISARMSIASDAEITLESNPGSAETSRFNAYRQAGINRLSIGVQSFDDRTLQTLGRIHSGDEARKALDLVSEAGFDRWNIDLMHGLPGQHADSAEADLAEAIDRSAGHISWYQLTIERNTHFWSTRPELPDEAALEAIQNRGEALLRQTRFEQYEVSAFSGLAEQSQHNLNYWGFGDYIGLGAGAHGKISLPDNKIIRTQRTRSPSDYLKQLSASPAPQPPFRSVANGDRIVEFAMNTLRLREGVPLDQFTERTGLPQDDLVGASQIAVARGWLTAPEDGRFAATPLGFRFLDSVVETFL
jgi:oxygen-independent coproporphyrinogen-3 oxidase